MCGPNERELLEEYGATIRELLEECGTIYGGDVLREDSAVVSLIESSTGEMLIRVADFASEWFGDLAACKAAIADLRQCETWQDGWDALGEGVDAPDDWWIV